MSSGTEFLTKELSLAAMLNLRGHTHTRLELRDDRTAVWVFPRMASLLADADDYHDGQAFVEPKTFTLMLSKVRNEMYRFVQEERKRVAHSRG